MPVRLDLIPAPASPPAWPRVWLWLCVLPLLLLLLGACGAFLFGIQASGQRAENFWSLAVGIPLLGWCLLGCCRVLLYSCQQGRTDGWNEAREETVINGLRRGRRVQQVLAVSLHTALRAPGEEHAAQLTALLSGTCAIKARGSESGAAVLRHSRLSRVADEACEDTLLRIVEQVLCDLAQTLTLLPDDTPLALLLEIDSALPANILQRVWRQAWSESGIRQPTVAVEGDGLDAVDRWLDQRINDRALLLVVALQIAPQQPEGKAEAAVGLLFGNRLTQHTLPPMAYLHRPEQQREPTPDALLYAARQALDWVPLKACSIEQTWQVGIDTPRDAALSTALAAVPLPARLNHGFCNVDSLLGRPGIASPWLAIAAASQAIHCGAGAQFIFSGESRMGAGLWSTVLTPVSLVSK
jgi:hypothetical protein